ncbi:MAG TPA: glycosyltransferase family 9 protein [Stellaceae bacterium]|nr:glycosyltransferase family 9 protein [Stellaceae bacterium]
MAAPQRILVIKLSALGDFVQAMGAAAAIRSHHRGAAITLLTTAPYAELARQAPYFDAVWLDERPGWTNPASLLRLRRRLREGRFDRVYDLQTRRRSNFYFRLMRQGGGPEWSGIAAGASHPHTNPARDHMHTLDRQDEQLRMAGIPGPVPLPDLSWAAADIARFSLPADYVLLMPGGAAHRPQKRWPAENYAALAARLAAAGLTPVVVGGADERALGRIIAAAAPQSRDLTGATGFGDIVALGRGARRAVGNDTGPMHLAVAGGAPATVLYSAASDPALTAPRGTDVIILRAADLADLSIESVATTMGLTA